jgi:tetratricopeptide (TPR) repeat protein
MFDRIAKNLHPRAARLAGVAWLLVAAQATAQAPAPASPPLSTAQFDPSDVYYKGYLTTRDAEKLEANGDFAGASEKLKRARELFEAVQRHYPTWKPEMVTGRSARNQEAQERLFSKAEEQRKKKQTVVAELEGGVKSPATVIDTPAVPFQQPGIFEVDPIAARRLAEAEAEVKRLRDLAKTQSAKDAEASRNESRLRDIAAQRDLAQAQLNAAEANVQSLRNRLSVNPLEGEMKTLNQRISGLEQEREAMAMALAQSRGSHTEALSRIAILQADLTVMKQKHANLERDLKVEREVGNGVIAGQRTQLQALEKELVRKDGELAKANERISGLINQLSESQDAFAQLRTERDALLVEREQMSALLKLNENGRIQDLVQQNMGLAKNLREANEKVERLNLDNNSAKDDLTDALRDLAIAKSQINKLHQEKREQDNRLGELKERLKSEEEALAKGQVTANAEEIAVLRDIIARQLRVQERRRQARDQLLEAVKEMGAKDERVAQAIQMFEGDDIQLTPEEQRLIADKNVDGEFVSPVAKDRATFEKNTTELNRDIAVYERTAEKSYAAGRLLPTRELFQMVIEQHPGHIPALCKLGVVNLRLKDTAAAVDNFRRAVELDANQPYAHRMLGLSFFKLGDLSAAENSARKAEELAPDDATSHLLLANIIYNLGRIGEAESHFKAAISADPIPNEPYYNLALICSRDQRLEAARTYYHDALERGAVPDPKLEQRLAE